MSKNLATLQAMMGSVETEHGPVDGIDVGSIFDDSSREVENDRTRYAVDVADMAEAEPGWEVWCHSMASNGQSVRRYYLARPMTKRLASVEVES